MELADYSAMVADATSEKLFRGVDLYRNMPGLLRPTRSTNGNKVNIVEMVS